MSRCSFSGTYCNTATGAVWISGAPNCLTCPDGTYLDGTTCTANCPEGTWANALDNTCDDCNNSCKCCSGPDDD
jgi:hypothetical protein